MKKLLILLILCAGCSSGPSPRITGYKSSYQTPHYYVPRSYYPYSNYYYVPRSYYPYSNYYYAPHSYYPNSTYYYDRARARYRMNQIIKQLNRR